MEQEVEIYCKKDNKKKDCTCLWTIIAIITVILSFFLGLLIESVAGVVAALGIGAIIVLLITLVILLVIALIALWCCKRNKDKKRKCCF